MNSDSTNSSNSVDYKQFKAYSLTSACALPNLSEMSLREALSPLLLIQFLYDAKLHDKAAS